LKYILCLMFEVFMKSNERLDMTIVIALDYVFSSI